MATNEKQKIADITNQLPSGIWKIDSPVAIPLWAEGANVRFTPNGVAKIKGWSAPLTPSAAIAVRGMHQFRASNGTQYIYWGDTTSLYSWNTLSVTQEATGFSGNLNQSVTEPASTWSIENYGDYILATNGVDTPQIDIGSGFGALGADFTTVEILLRKGPHMLGFNTSINSRGFVWSAQDDVTDWTPSSENAAGDLVLREANSEIYCAVPLGDYIAAYTKDQMFLIQYIGAPLYFGYQPALEGIGAVSKKSVVSIGRRNFGLSRHGAWVTDGTQFQAIDDPAVREFLQADINWNQASKINGWHDEENQMIIWYYPSVAGSECDVGVGYQYAKGVWTLFDFARTSALDRDVFDYPLSADSSGNIYYQNFGDDADGSALTAYIRTKITELGNESLIKLIDNLRMEWDGTGLQYRVGTAANHDAAISWGAYTAIPAGNQEENVRVSGRYFALEFYSDQVGDDWELFGLTVYGKAAGRR